MPINMTIIIDNYFLSMLETLNFSIKEKTKTTYKFIYMNKNEYIFRINKLTRSNEIHFYLAKPNTKYPLYTIRLIVLTKGNIDEKLLFENSTDYFSFDNEEELVGIFNFVFDIISRFANSFFMGELDKEIDSFIKMENARKKENNKNLSKEELYRIGHEKVEKWRRTRFLMNK